MKNTSIYSFVDRKLHYIPKDKWNEYMNFERVDYKNKEYDDPKFNWIMCACEGSNGKYGRWMISEEYKLKRGLTMGEFYGTSPVD